MKWVQRYIQMRAAPNSETDQVKSGETMDNQGSSQVEHMYTIFGFFEEPC